VIIIFIIIISVKWKTYKLNKTETLPSAGADTASQFSSCIETCAVSDRNFSIKMT
jgi:hypothetical protein